MTGFERLARNCEKGVPKIVSASNNASAKSAQMVREFAIHFSSGTVPLSVMSRSVASGGLAHPGARVV